jgi:hypothetical protein
MPPGCGALILEVEDFTQGVQRQGLDGLPGPTLLFKRISRGERNRVRPGPRAGFSSPTIPLNVGGAGAIQLGVLVSVSVRSVSDSSTRGDRV